MPVVGWRFSRRENVATWHVSRTLNLSRAKEPHPSREQSRFFTCLHPDIHPYRPKTQFFFLSDLGLLNACEKPEGRTHRDGGSPDKPGRRSRENTHFHTKTRFTKVNAAVAGIMLVWFKSGFSQPPFFIVLSCSAALVCPERLVSVFCLHLSVCV